MIQMYSQEWLEVCIQNAREYAAETPSRLDDYIAANGFSAKHERIIRNAVGGADNKLL